MTYERIQAYAFDEGTQQAKIEAATNLLKLDALTPEQISSAIGLPLDTVLELKQKVGVHA